MNKLVSIALTIAILFNSVAQAKFTKSDRDVNDRAKLYCVVGDKYIPVNICDSKDKCAVLIPEATTGYVLIYLSCDDSGFFEEEK